MEPAPTPANLIDRVLAPRLAEEGIVPVPAGAEEICRRLSADLLGRFMTADEAFTDCVRRPVEEMAAEFQGREEYLVLSERHWRDRFGTTDVFAGWRDLKHLYGLVDALHRDELPYDAFAVEAMSHPAIMTLFQLPEERAERAFAAFMGRPPSASERLGLAALYRPWGRRNRTDPDVRLISTAYATVDPALCSPASSCATDLYGVTTELDFSSFEGLPDGPARWYNLTDDQKDALREPGRLLVNQPFFWEAAADEILNRLLGWSDGGSLPNEPGILLPEVREVLTDHLRETKSIAQGERLVIGSWLYRMSSRVPPDGFGDDPAAPTMPLWATGPRKAILAEGWLRSAGETGDCDPRYPDHHQFTLLAQPGEEYEEARLTLWTLQENRTPWDPVAKSPDLRFREVARSIGGCPGFQLLPLPRALPRLPQTGLAHAFAQESLVEEICSRLPDDGAEVTVAGELERQTRLYYGRSATAGEVRDYEAAFHACPGCGPGEIRRGVCVGLLGGAEMVFH